MMDKIPGIGSPRQLAVKIFKKEGGEEILIHQAEMEAEIIDIANRFLEETEVGEPIESHDTEERAEQLTRGIIGLVDNNIEGFYAGEIGRFRCNCEPDQVKRYVNMDSEEWESQKQTWYDKYLANDMADEDDTPEDVADIHVRNAFGITLEEFENEIIEWPEGKDADVIRRLFSGDSYDKDHRLFTGHMTARNALELALKEV